MLDEIRSATEAMARRLRVVGLMNVQFRGEKRKKGKGPQLYVLEVNPRASRTVPFVAKATRSRGRETGGQGHGRMTLAELV